MPRNAPDQKTESLAAHGCIRANDFIGFAKVCNVAILRFKPGAMSKISEYHVWIATDLDMRFLF